MPLLQGQNQFTQRIYNGDVKIRRVFLGDTLMWGLYLITYNLAGSTQGSNPINEYVWGLANYDLPKPTWSNQQYLTKFNGWYEGNTYVQAIPAINKNLHKDLDLYAKWTQRKYTYSGTYTWTEQQQTGGGADFDPYTDTTPIDRWGGQCTRYCHDRTLEAFGVACMTGYPNACNWLESGTLGEGWERIPGASPEPGDVVVFDDSGNYAGHVIFQETESIITQSNVRYPGYGWNSVIAARYERFSCVPIGTPSTYLSNKRLGVLRYKGGSHFEPVTKSVTVTESQSETMINQKSPPSSPPIPSGVPSGGSWSVSMYTYTRDYSYPMNNWSSWGNQQSGWDTSGNGTDWL